MKKIIIVCFTATFLLSIAWIFAFALPTERIVIQSKYDFKKTLSHLEKSIGQNKLFVVTRANAQGGARSQGVTIPGNQVWGIFGPQYAVRMLKASIDAGFEAPIRMYIVENADQSVEVSYILPSLIFQPYNHPDLNKMADELDLLFQKIISVLQ